jgi:Leucine-rich repeat (LRR) protein
LDLSGNPQESKTLPTDLFSKLKNLEELDLNSMKISHFQPEIFQSLKNLQSLVLRLNEFASFPANLFTSLERLSFLDFVNNKITSLNTNAFGILPYLETLSLSNNKIKQIEVNFFSNFPSLVYVDAYENDCISDAIYDLNAMDFNSSTVFDACFSNLTDIILETTDAADIEDTTESLHSTVVAPQEIQLSQCSGAKLSSKLIYLFALIVLF